MQSKKKIKARTQRGGVKKMPVRRKGKVAASKEVPLTYQRKVEEEFIGEHPEAFEPFVGEWVAMEGREILAHGYDVVKVTEEARARGTNPYMFRVLPKRKPNEGYLF